RRGDRGADAVRKRDAVGHRDAGERDEWDDVDRAETRMLPLVPAHVDGLVRRVDERERRALDRVGLAGEREDRAVVIGIARPIEQSYAGRCGDDPREAVDDVEPTAFTDVRNALDDARHGRERT